MKIAWQVTSADIAQVRKLLGECKDNPFVCKRRDKNCADVKPRTNRLEFWREMVIARCTSRQRSGPDSPVGRFARTNPFPLRYEVVMGAKRVRPLIREVLQDWGGIRFVPTIAIELTKNLRKLEEGHWSIALSHCDSLRGPHSREAEVNAAKYIADAFDGFGPKQSRNLLQELGLTQYEIPIDSRVTDWLNRFGFPVRLSAAALADDAYYNFVSDGIQELCAKSDLLPCIFDAVIFSLKDGERWAREIAN